jgi:hypothetical protein
METIAYQADEHPVWAIEFLKIHRQCEAPGSRRLTTTTARTRPALRAVGFLNRLFKRTEVVSVGRHRHAGSKQQASKPEPRP